VDLYYGGDFYRDYLHVDDVCRAMRLLMDKAPLNAIFNVGRGENLKFRDLIDQLVSLTGSRSELRAIEPPEFHRTVQVKDMYLDVARLTQLGFAPQISVNDALASIVAPAAEEVPGG
jgi:nucleoside-diphosphate-sugar epimerase